jgi:peptidoglycan/LPS O-acetylase OafA/YrhL
MIALGTTSPEASLARPILPSGAVESPVFERNAALDFAKGGLVLCMVAYHSINYFRYDVQLLRHLHFVPSSFIFIAGFLLTHVYLPKMRAGDAQAYRRLFVRGLKVLILFTVLNVIVQAVFQTSYNRRLGLDVFIAQLDTIFLTGERRAAVFGVLLPISYLLLVSSVILRVVRRWPWALHALAVAAFALCVALEQRGLLTFNLELLSMGLIGMVVGFAPKRWLDRLAVNLSALVVIYVAYFAATHVWYPSYLINAVGVALSLLLLYAVGQRIGSRGLIARNAALIGNYSLLSYLVQIAVLQFLFRLSRATGVMERDLVVPFLATILVTFALIKAVNFARVRSSAADRTYKFVFA